MLTVRFPVALLVAVLAMLPAPMTAAENYDVGEIAIVEDTDGSITAAALTQFYQMRAACAFYRTHADQYDALFIFTTHLLDFVNNVAQGFPVNSPSQGIGRGEPSQTQAFCSQTGRLRQAVKMGSIQYCPADPDDPYLGIPLYTLSGVELIGHEFGHQWLANVDFDKGDGERQCLLRAYMGASGLPDPTEEQCNGHPESTFNQHWSRYLNQPSVMYANSIEDLGGGRFRIFHAPLKYGELDQYLMGLRLSEEVAPTFVALQDQNTITDGFPIAEGQEQTIEGERLDVSVDDIIRRMGPRVPELEECHWKGAFIIVHDAGQPPTQEQIALVDAYRKRWEAWYAWATDGRGSFDTTLDGCGTGAETCPGEIEPSCGAAGCLDGETRCAGPTALETCLGGAWGEAEECPLDHICRNGECTDVGGDGDAPDGDAPDGDPDGDRPDGDVPDGDAADGDATDGDSSLDGDESAPEDGDAPVDGDIPVERICSPGATQCLGDLWQRCIFSGAAWQIERDCSRDDRGCDDEEGCVKSGGCQGAPAAPAGMLFIVMLLGVCFIRRRV